MIFSIDKHVHFVQLESIFTNGVSSVNSNRLKQPRTSRDIHSSQNKTDKLNNHQIDNWLTDQQTLHILYDKQVDPFMWYTCKLHGNDLIQWYIWAETTTLNELWTAGCIWAYGMVEVNGLETLGSEQTNDPIKHHYDVKYDVATSFWRDNDIIITSCARWVLSIGPHSMSPR